MIYNKGYDCYININFKGGIDVIYKGDILPQYIGSKKGLKHPYPLVDIPDHGEACVHRLVAYCYGVLTRPKDIIDHIDNNPYNSLPFNLRAVNRSENMIAHQYQLPRTPENMELWEQHWRETTITK